jgi:hypothetical protein
VLLFGAGRSRYRLALEAGSCCLSSDLIGAWDRRFVTLEEIYRGLPPPANLADRQEGRRAYDVATDVLATIECVLEDDLRPAVETLQRSASVTDAELERQFQEWRRRRLL